MKYKVPVGKEFLTKIEIKRLTRQIDNQLKEIETKLQKGKKR